MAEYLFIATTVETICAAGLMGGEALHQHKLPGSQRMFNKDLVCKERGAYDEHYRREQCCYRGDF